MHEEVARFSPVNASFMSGARVDLLFASLETLPLRQQAVQLAIKLGEVGKANRTTQAGGANHMSIAPDLGTPTSVSGAMLVGLVHS